MGLRCLLGHDFGPPEMEREREENGDEMIVTVREVETCRRCGEERVVSENKEVTAIRSPDEVGLDDDGSEEREATAEPDAAAEPDATSADGAATSDVPDAVDGGDDDGVILDADEEEAERGHGEWPDSDGATATESAGRVDAAAEAVSDASGSTEDEPVTDEPAQTTDVADVAAEEGAELLDTDDSDDDSADVGEERPDAAEATESTGGAESWPEHEETDEGFDAEQATGGGPADVSFGGGLSPDAAESTAERGRGEYVGSEGTDDDEFEDIVRVESDADEDADATEFFCPNCGLTERAGETSMRVGDICPSCHKGYVAERNA